MTATRVTVWTVRTDQPASVVAGLARLLDERELRRAAGMPDPVRRAQFVVAHGALREIVGAQVGQSPAALRWRNGANGKPHLTGSASGMNVNLSTCGSLALVALAEGRETGVDIEHVPDDRVALRLSERYFPAAEYRYVADGAAGGETAQRFATLWSRKEACVKARGGRLAQGMPLRVDAAAPFTVGWPAAGHVHVDELPVPTGYRAAVALAGSDPILRKAESYA